MSFTCISCKVIFSVPELQREHYKSDWHRYNLKRKVAELPAVTKNEFDQRAAAFNSTKKGDEKDKIYSCILCNKHFATENAIVNHLKSRKHVELQSVNVETEPLQISEKKSGNAEVEETPQEQSDDEAEEIDDDGEWESCDDEEELFDIKVCFFCMNASDSVEHNISHMSVAHSFFIPDAEYVSDLDGLISYLSGKVLSEHLCLWCNDSGKTFHSAMAAQHHMFDKGHCKMLYGSETLAEYASFYDYSGSYDDATEDNLDLDVMLDIIDGDNYELTLPSGATIGHRSLALYYRQNLKPAGSDNETKVKKVIQQYKALGWTGTMADAAVKTAKDIHFMNRIKSRYDLKLKMKQNKFQPHFRPQVMF